VEEFRKTGYWLAPARGRESHFWPSVAENELKERLSTGAAHRRTDKVFGRAKEGEDLHVTEILHGSSSSMSRHDRKRKELLETMSTSRGRNISIRRAEGGNLFKNFDSRE